MFQLTRKSIKGWLRFTVSPAWRWFWGPFILLYLLSLGVIFSWSQNEYSTLMTHIEYDERRFLELYQARISDSVDHVLFDLEWLRHQNDLAAWLETGQPSYLQELAEDYLGLLSVRPCYDQLRIIDSTGHEVLRVGWNENFVKLVPPEDLQDKSEHYYIQKTNRLPKGSVYISPMDLNVENGRIERPFRPMMRFVVPAYDSTGVWRGSIVVNYLAEEITDVLRQMSRKVSGSLVLLNRDGYWLISDTPEDEWGFMLEARSERLFYKDYPEAWVQFQHLPVGQFLNRNGLFSFASVDLKRIYNTTYHRYRDRLGDHLETVISDANWLLISHVPTEQLEQRFASLNRSKWISLLFALLASLLTAGLFYRNRTRQQTHQEELEKMAFYDNLTGLTSRALFIDQLKEMLHLSRREGDHFALMVIDLDGFKQINDTFGHQGGDKLLCMVAERLQQSVRSTDTVARTGGDEFSIILSQVEHQNVARQLAEKILAQLRLPYLIDQRKCHIGASIGFSVSTELEQDADVLWKQADIAMYRAKQGGKNQICSYEIA